MKKIPKTKKRGAKQNIESNVITGHSFLTHERSVAWSGVITITYLLLLIIALFTAQFTLASILILATVVYFLIANFDPHHYAISLNDQSIRINDRLINYDSLRWFRLFHTPKGNFLLELQSIKRSRLPIGIHINQNQAELIFKKLAPHVPWNVRINETISDRLSRWFRI